MIKTVEDYLSDWQREDAEYVAKYARQNAGSDATPETLFVHLLFQAKGDWERALYAACKLIVETK